MNEKFITKIFLFLTNSPRFHYELIPFELHKKLGNNILFGTNLIKPQIQPNITINITGANPQIYPSAEQITHNHYYGDQFAEDAIKANKKEILLNQEGGEKDDTPDQLYAILQDDDLYEETVKWAETCRKPKDIRDRIFVPLRRKGINDIGIDFINALIPHLTNYTSSKNPSTIQKQLY